MLREEDLPNNPSELIEIYRQAVDQYEKIRCEESLYEFTKAAWEVVEPSVKFIENWHLKVVCGYLEAFHYNQLPDKRLIINIPPSGAKSLVTSVTYPCWTWIHNPGERILTFSAEKSLATRDALKMKHIITSEWFQKYWGDIKLSEDQNEKTLYLNNKFGYRQATGITASNTGKRASLIILDDVLDSKQAFSDIIRQNVNDTWDQSINSRLNDPVTSGVVLIMQRLHQDDLTGHLLKKTKEVWTHLKIPMRYEGTPTFDGNDIGRPDLVDPRTKKGELMFPARFPERSVQALEESLGEYGACGQLQQRPSPLGGGIIKKHWWRVWPDDIPLPICDHIFISFDTAFSEADSKNAAFSAATRWGIFWHEQRDRYCILALGMWFDRVGYDELRRIVQEMDKKHKPDILLIEKKATGITLVQDMKRAVPGSVKSYSPGKGEDKISRAHSVSPMLESGQVYIPNKEWALGNGKDKLGLIDYVASFPTGAPPSADLTDTVTAALIYLRAGHWSGDHDDDKEAPYEAGYRSEEDIEDAHPQRTGYYT
jgi:phage terminase large subunit-like protein